MPFNSSRGQSRLDWPTLTLILGLLGASGQARLWAHDLPDRDSAVAEPKQVPEALNFANGLFRDRHYKQAAEEYEGFLKEAKPGHESAEAIFGLANSRLFQGQFGPARRHFEDFLKAAPDHPNAATALYRVGETSYMLGDLPAARQALEAFTAKNPKNRYLDTAWPYLGDVCLRLGDLSKARQAYEQALGAHPDGPMAERARFGLGRVLALQGERDEAMKILSALAEHGGREWADKAWLQVGQIHVGTGHLAEAITAFEAVERIEPKSPLIDEARLNRAEALTRLGRRDEAEPMLRALLVDAPPSLAAPAAFALGTSLLERGQAAEALRILDDARTRFPKSSMVTALLFRSAEAALRLGQAEDARGRFLKAAEADPNDPWADDAMLRAAGMALEARDTASARNLAASLPTRFPNSPLRADAHLIEARAALAGGQSKDAIAILTATLAEDKPTPATAQAGRYCLGLAYRADGQAAKANEMLDALARAPSAPLAADAQYMVGQGHIEAKQFAEAIPPLEKYLAAKPEGEVADYALAHLAIARIELGEIDAASKGLAQLADRFPKSKALAPTQLRLAEALLAVKKTAPAAELFRRVIEGTDAALKSRARSGLGWLLLESGEPAEAAAVFAALLAAAPDDPLAPEAALARGKALEAAGQTEEALTAYALTSEKFPRTDQADFAALARARLLIDAKRPGEAAQAFARYIQDHPDTRSKEPKEALDALLAEWGWALVDAGKTAEADRAFSRLLHEFPESSHADDARFNLAESAFQAKHYDEAIRLLTTLVAEGSKAAPKLVQSALFRLGRSQAETKDWPGAAQTLDRLISGYPEGPFRREARFWRAEVAFQSDDGKTAEEGFAALAAEPPVATDPEGFATTVRRRQIQSLVLLERWREALSAAETFKSEISQDPLMAEVDYVRGRAFQGLARFDEARAAYQAVIDARKGGDLAARAQFMRGETYFHQKAYREAVREFLKVDVLYDAPSWQAAALLEAGKVYEQLAQWADAAETYERVRSKFPDDPSAAAAKPLLDAVRRRAEGQPCASGTANAAIP